MMEISRLWGEKPDWLWGEDPIQQMRLLAWYRVYCEPKKKKSAPSADPALNSFAEMAEREPSSVPYDEDDQDECA